MWTELAVIFLICLVAFMAYNNMKPDDTCTITITKPNTGIKIPDISCNNGGQNGTSG